MPRHLCANCFVWFSRKQMPEPYKSAARKPCRNSLGPCVNPKHFGTHQLATKAKCPTCGRLMDGALHMKLEEVAPPAEGDLTVCAYCSTLMTFVGGGGLREMTAAELEALPEEDRTTLLRARNAVRRNPMPLLNPKRGSP